MIKEIDVVFRVDADFKAQIISEAKKNGLSISSWIRFVLVNPLNNQTTNKN